MALPKDTSFVQDVFATLEQVKKEKKPKTESKSFRLNKLCSVKHGKEYVQYTITVPKKLAEANDLHRIQDLEWVQGAKGSLILKPKD